MEETIDEDAGDYSDEDDITDEWDGLLILSDVKECQNLNNTYRKHTKNSLFILSVIFTVTKIFNKIK